MYVFVCVCVCMCVSVLSAAVRIAGTVLGMKWPGGRIPLGWPASCSAAPFLVRCFRVCLSNEERSRRRKKPRNGRAHGGSRIAKSTQVVMQRLRHCGRVRESVASSEKSRSVYLKGFRATEPATATGKGQDACHVVMLVKGGRTRGDGKGASEWSNGR